MAKPSTIGTESKVELPKYAEGLKCTYPSEQAKRGADNEILAVKFREKDVMDRNKGREDGY